MGKIICVAQQKGGVCKTTATLSISSALSMMGKKVLMIDIDPQCNLTRNILDYSTVKKSVLELYQGSEEIGTLITRTQYENLFIIPAKTSLSRIDNIERTLSSFNAMKNNVMKIKDGFDFIFYDTPPSLGIFTVSALIACEYVLVPVQPTFFCQEGLADLHTTIKQARENNENLKSVRYFITLFDKRTVINQELASQMKNDLKDKVFTTIINRSVAIEESQYAQKTIYDYSPKSQGAIDFEKLSKEIYQWLENN